jgi:hypothetical protein
MSEAQISDVSCMLMSLHFSFCIANTRFINRPNVALAESKQVLHGNYCDITVKIVLFLSPASQVIELHSVNYNTYPYLLEWLVQGGFAVSGLNS